MKYLRSSTRRIAAVLVIVSALGAVGGATSRDAHAVVPNTVSQWNKISEDTVVGSGAFQNEGLIYMGYVSAAVYDAVVAIDGGYEPYGPPIAAPNGASADAAVIEAAYRTLLNYFPSQAAALTALYTPALAAIPAGQAKSDGQAVGLQAANDIVALRANDGRMTPIGVTSAFETKSPGPGVWRRTPPFAAPQTPWVGSVQPFVLKKPGQFQPEPPVPLESQSWVEQFNEMKAYGSITSTVRTPEQTAIAKFFTANVIRQINLAARDLANTEGLGLLETARLMGMINVVTADAQMSVMNAKYKFLFWRPVTAIDPSAVSADGYGPVPGFDDGNPATVEEPGWRPLITTPNHPEYPAAHGTLTSSFAEVLSEFLGTDDINLDLHGFDPAGAAGNLNAVRHYDTAEDLRSTIVNARLWAGLHFRRSSEAGVALGQKVAHYDLNHAFRRVG